MRPAMLRLAPVLLLGACADPQADRPSVLLVTVDTLRADHVGAYGYERDTTPHLDALAGESALFERAYSHAPFTAPSHASLFTGLNTQSHGVVFWAHRVDPAAATLAGLFGAAGYATGAFQNHPGLVPTGLLEDFETRVTETSGPWPDTLENFFGWLDGVEGEFCAWVHLWDVHRPYGWREWTPEILEIFGDTRREPGRMPFAEQGFGPAHDPRVGRLEAHYNVNREERAGPLPLGGQARPFGEADWRHIVDRYDNGVRFADQGLGELVRGLRERGLLDSTILVVTADHGETLVERDEVWFTHDPYLFEETLRVPLVMRFPDGRFAGAREGEAIARGIDVLPTLLTAAGIEPPSSLQGRDLARVLDGTDRAPVTLLAQTQTRTAKERKAAVQAPDWLEFRQAVTDGRHKLLVDLDTGGVQLFDLEADPRERRDLLAGGELPPEGARLRDELARLRRELPVAAIVPASMSAEEEAAEREKLRLLGYIDEDAEEGGGR